MCILTINVNHFEQYTIPYITSCVNNNDEQININCARI